MIERKIRTKKEGQRLEKCYLVKGACNPNLARRNNEPLVGVNSKVASLTYDDMWWSTDDQSFLAPSYPTIVLSIWA